MNRLSEEDQENIRMHLENWRDTETMSSSVEDKRDAKDALMGAIISAGVSQEVFIIDEVVLADLLYTGEEVENGLNADQDV
uniref:Uncharacterized protein n=1 Tax=viral metagenome TaxID=1070528 RepID=A0A6M3K115_9ZZZZ